MYGLDLILFRGNFMQLFLHLNEEVYKELFFRAPHVITEETPTHIKAMALGATLYMPAFKEDIANRILYKSKGFSSVVLCLEDAIREDQLTQGEKNIIQAIERIDAAVQQDIRVLEPLPMIFIRVRNIEQFIHFAEKLQPIRYIAGFVFPKFDSINGAVYFKTLEEISCRNNRILYGMPIIETKEVIYKETRIQELLHIKTLLDQYRDYVLNVRIGGTDFSGYFGLRRSIHQSLYDIKIVSDCVGDILNIFARGEGGYVVSGGVWEYFGEDMSNALWREGLIREVLMDQSNGIMGKTVIHPSQVPIVNALYSVSKEQYLDAVDIVESSGGVISSQYKNKMNETRPHLVWAHKILTRAHVYGVLNEGVTYEALLSKEKQNEQSTVTYLRRIAD